MNADNLERSIRESDHGDDWGNFSSSTAKKIFSGSTYLHIAPLVQFIRDEFSEGHTIRIGDFGGGTGAIAKALISSLPEYSRLEVNVLDIDSSKFSKDTNNLKYMKHDLRQFPPYTSFYSWIMCRYVLHYHKPADQKLIFRTIDYGLGLYGRASVIDMIPITPAETKRANALFRLLHDLTGVHEKHWSTRKELEAMIGRQGFKIYNVIEEQARPHSVDSFYRERYSLNDEQCRKVNDFLKDEPIMLKATNFLLTKC